VHKITAPEFLYAQLIISYCNFRHTFWPSSGRKHTSTKRKIWQWHGSWSR